MLDKVTDFLFFLGKLLIVGSVGEFREFPPAAVPKAREAFFHLIFPILLSPGILAFFFFTQRIKLVQDTAPPLNYYWVPILVSRPLSLGWFEEEIPHSSPSPQPGPQGPPLLEVFFSSPGVQ